MRHLLHLAESVAVAILTQGMVAPAGIGPLVSDPGQTNRLAPGDFGAPI